MPSQPPIPPLLSPHFSSLPPANSLTLLTSVLSSPINWLVLRFIYAALKDRSGLEHEEKAHVKVILVSWLTGFESWREGGRKLGLDLLRSNHLTFIDGLSTKLGLVPSHSESSSLVETEIKAAINHFTAPQISSNNKPRVLLVLDGLDFLLAATDIQPRGILDMICELREVLGDSLYQPLLSRSLQDDSADYHQHVHSVIITASADHSLIHTRNTPLEISHAAFAMGLAHQARMVMGLRGLDTGVARDVSGVLRITRGGGNEDGAEVEEKEVLYFVGGDAGVRVFERGA